MANGYKDCLNENSVLLVGNGVNLREVNTSKVSWYDILQSINKEDIIPKGYPLTEYFELLKNNDKNASELKDNFIDSIKELSYNNAHKDIIEACVEAGAVLMTTNFDHAFQSTGLFKTAQTRDLSKGFTNYYPWQRFYEHESGMKLWHINGDMRYKNSVKLSVMDYAGNLNYFRKFDPQERNSRYRIDETWINEIFEKDLIIMGLSLSEAEIFIRHILIRRNAWARSKNLNLQGKYLMVNESASGEEKRLEFFLKHVGIEIVRFESYDQLYRD